MRQAAIAYCTDTTGAPQQKTQDRYDARDEDKDYQLHAVLKKKSFS